MIGRGAKKMRHEIQAVQETQHPTALSHAVRPIQFTDGVYFSFPRWISFISSVAQIPALTHISCSSTLFGNTTPQRQLECRTVRV